jgi:hypothetical protein
MCVVLEPPIDDGEQDLDLHCCGLLLPKRELRKDCMAGATSSCKRGCGQWEKGVNCAKMRKNV